MAEVLIILKDDEAGGVAMALESEPPLRPDDLSGAQTLALAMLSSVADPSDITKIDGEPVR